MDLSPEAPLIPHFRKSSSKSKTSKNKMHYHYSIVTSYTYYFSFYYYFIIIIIIIIIIQYIPWSQSYRAVQSNNETSAMPMNPNHIISCSLYDPSWFNYLPICNLNLKNISLAVTSKSNFQSWPIFLLRRACHRRATRYSYKYQLIWISPGPTG